MASKGYSKLINEEDFDEQEKQRTRLKDLQRFEDKEREKRNKKRNKKERKRSAKRKRREEKGKKERSN